MQKRRQVILIIIVASIIALSILLYNVLPNFKKVTQEEYFDEFVEEQINVVIGAERISLDNPVTFESDVLYFPIDFVKSNISKDVFWDPEENIFTITNIKEMMRFTPGEPTYELNYNEEEIESAVIVKNNVLYVPYDLIEEKYNIITTYDSENEIIVVDDTSVDRVIGKLTKRSTRVRVEPNIKSPVLEKIYKDDHIMTYGSKDGWTKVRTLDGNIGYIKEKTIEYFEQIDKEAIKYSEAQPIKKEIDGNVVMAWDQIGEETVLNFNSAKYKFMQGVNVLSPTWLEFKDDLGNLENKSDKEYIKWAHSKGYQVWPLMSHNFSNSSWTHEILSSTRKRDVLIKQLLEYVREYNVDGINIDIESLQEQTGPYWVQFMSELYPVIKQEGIYVSTDVYVPSPWTIHYNRGEIAKVVDYLVIMAYDQHWSGSEEAGPVGAIPWVKTAIEDTLEEVPEEKIILGVPFYARLWEENNDELTSRAIGMTGIESVVKENDVIPTWDESAGQLYGEYSEGDSLYRVWIEDDDSIKERASFVNRYGLGGIAGWKLGLEKETIWRIIDETLEE